MHPCRLGADAVSASTRTRIVVLGRGKSRTRCRFPPPVLLVRVCVAMQAVPQRSSLAVGEAVLRVPTNARGFVQKITRLVGAFFAALALPARPIPLTKEARIRVAHSARVRATLAGVAIGVGAVRVRARRVGGRTVDRRQHARKRSNRARARSEACLGGKGEIKIPYAHDAILNVTQIPHTVYLTSPDSTVY